MAEGDVGLAHQCSSLGAANPVHAVGEHVSYSADFSPAEAARAAATRTCALARDETRLDAVQELMTTISDLQGGAEDVGNELSCFLFHEPGARRP